MIVLASTSPRRADLLRAAGLELEVLDPGLGDAEEARLVDTGESTAPTVVAARLAMAKLLAALPQVAPGRTVVAADTLVACDGRLLGKAADEAHARSMLEGLRDRDHYVVTGVALVTDSGRLHLATESTRVRFAAFDPAVLAAYLDAGLWQGKAGAYGLQDPPAAPLISAVEGCRDNVKGLPVALVLRLLGYSLPR